MVCSHPAWLPNCSAWPQLSSEPDGDAEGCPHTHSPGTSAGDRFSWFCLQEIVPRVLSPVCLHPWWKLCTGSRVATGTRKHGLPLSLGSWVLKAAWCELPRWTVEAVSREKPDFHSKCSLSTFYPDDFSVLSRPSMKVNVFSVSGVFSICLTFSKSILLPACWRAHYSYSTPISPWGIKVCTNITASWQAEDN